MLLYTVIKIDHEYVLFSESSVSQIYFEFSRFYCKYPNNVYWLIYHVEVSIIDNDINKIFTVQVGP